MESASSATAAAGPSQPTDVSDASSSEAGAASSSVPIAENPPPAALGRYETEEANEASMVDDLHVTQSIELGPEDVPDHLSDESSLPDDSSSVASEAMDDALPEPEPPAEDHSVQQLTTHTEPVFAVAVNATHPEIFATGGGDDVAYLWRVGQPTPVIKLEGHTDTVSSLAFSSDGTLLATAGLDGQVRVWEAATGRLVVALEGATQGINWICWHARGAVLLAGSEDATAWMWKLPEGTVMQIFSAHSASVAYGGFVNSGRSVLTGSEDGTVRVWNPRTGTVDHCLHTTSTHHEPRPVTALAGHPSQPVFLYGTDEGGLKLAHSETGKLVAALPGHEASIESVGFCDALPYAASAGMDGKLCVWDLGTLAQRQMCLHMAGVVELRWLKDSPMILSCTVSRELRLWDGRSGDCLQTLTGHHEAVLCLDIGYTSQGIYVVSGSDDRTARLWQPRIGS